MSHDSQQTDSMAEQAVAEEIERHGRDAVLLHPAPLPALSRVGVRSFFGGLPMLPPQLEWPSRVVGHRYSYFQFVAQIDLSELPPLAGSPLPEAGTLYFFANLNKEWMEPDDARVLFHAASNDVREERALPSIGIVQPGEPWPWLAPGELTNHPHYKYPIRFVPCRSYRAYSLGPQIRQAPPGTADAVQGRMQLRALEAALGPRRTIEDVWTFDADDASWPFAWSVIEHASRALCHRITSVCDEATDRDEAFEPVLRAAGKWIESASEHDALTRPDAATSAELRLQWHAWRKQIVAIAAALKIPASDHQKHPVLAPLGAADELLREAVRLACCLLRDRGGDESLVPEKYRRAIDDDWSWNRSLSMYQNPVPALNQMLGYGEAVQSTPLDRIDDVLLLQIKPDMYRPWWPDSDGFGVIQFWIGRDALAQGSFDRVSVNFDCT